MASLFKGDKVKLDLSQFSKNTNLINLEMLIIDCLIESKSNFKSLLAVDFPNVGNILMTYFCENTVLRVIKTLLPIIEANAEKVLVFYLAL